MSSPAISASSLSRDPTSIHSPVTGTRQAPSRQDFSPPFGRVHGLNEGKKLAGNGIGAQVKVDGRTAYEKDEFFVHHNDNLVGEEKSSSEGATGRERAAPGAPPCSEK